MPARKMGNSCIVEMRPQLNTLDVFGIQPRAKPAFGTEASKVTHVFGHSASRRIQMSRLWKRF